jgi:hypothetical protein
MERFVNVFVLLLTLLELLEWCWSWVTPTVRGCKVERPAQFKEGSVDAGHILVAVLIAIAAGWLAWVEFHCRRNRAEQTTGVTAERVRGVTGCGEQVRNGNHESLSSEVRRVGHREACSSRRT